MARVSIVETNLEFGDLSQRPETSKLVVHHVGDCDRDVAAAEVHQWHLDKGWAGIGYHYVVRQDGTVERGRPKWAIGAHAYGFNSVSLGILVVGNLAAHEPTEAQKESLANLLADLVDIHGLDPETDIVGHRDLMSTDCPGDYMYNLLPTIREQVLSL